MWEGVDRHDSPSLKPVLVNRLRGRDRLSDARAQKSLFALKFSRKPPDGVPADDSRSVKKGRNMDDPPNRIEPLIRLLSYFIGATRTQQGFSPFLTIDQLRYSD